MSDIERVAATLRQVAQANMKTKELIAAVRRQHPEATKKEIVRAAFYALTQEAGGEDRQAEQLHTFALTERATDEEAPVTVKARKKDRRKLLKAADLPKVPAAPVG